MLASLLFLIIVPFVVGWCPLISYCRDRHCGYSEQSLTSLNSLIFQLSATTTSKVSLYVEYEPVTAGLTSRVRSKPSECGKEHSIILYRLLSQTEYTYSVYVFDLLVPFTSRSIASGNFTTGPLPDILATFELTHLTGTPSYGMTLVTYPGPSSATYPPVYGRDSVAYVFDEQGRIVWWINITHPLHYFDSFGYDKGRVLNFHTPISKDIIWIAYLTLYGNKNLNLVTMAADRIQEWSPSGALFSEAFSDPACQYLHHEARYDGKLVWTMGYYSFVAPGYEKRQVVDVGLIWDRRSDDTVLKEVIDFRDFIHLDDRTFDSNSSAVFWPGCPPTGDINDGNEEDWSHGNSMSRAADGSGLIIVSFRNLDAIFAMRGIDERGHIQPGGVQKVWQIGGVYSDFTFDDESTRFHRQHDATMLHNGNILLYDNGVDPDRPYSRGLELKLDYNTMTVSKAWEGIYTLENGNSCFSYCCGSSEKLSNDHYLIQFPNCINEPSGFPGHAYAVEFDSSGNVIASFRNSLPDFGAIYRCYQLGATIGGEVSVV